MADNRKKVQVLIVDDQASIRALLRSILTNMGAEIVGEAVDGEDAIQQYQRLKPQLLLLDINMPRKDGIETLSELMQHQPRPLVIMMTSQNDASVVEHCLELGAANFLLKDSPPELIQQEIRTTWQEYLTSSKS